MIYETFIAQMDLLDCAIEAVGNKGLLNHLADKLALEDPGRLYATLSRSPTIYNADFWEVISASSVNAINGMT